MPFVVELPYRLHTYGREHFGLHPYPLKSRAESQAVDYRGQHTHLISFDTVESLGGTAHSAEDIASSDDDADLYAHGTSLLDVRSIIGQPIRVDAVLLSTHERLTAQFEQHSFICSHYSFLSVCYKEKHIFHTPFVDRRCRMAVFTPDERASLRREHAFSECAPPPRR